MRRLAAAVPAVALLAACTSSLGTGVPSVPPVTGVRAIVACPTGVHVPVSIVSVVPSVKLPPTSVLQVGSAIAFPTAPGARVGFGAEPQRDERSVVCRAVAGAGRAVLVARAPGYVRVAILAKSGGSARQLLIKVTS